MTTEGVSEECSFQRLTTEAVWRPDGMDREYLLRFLHGETCCDSPYAGEEDWPTILFTAAWGCGSGDTSDDGEEPYHYVLSVIAGLWLKDTGKFIGFWGADQGDGHVSFFCSKSYEHIEELRQLSGILCTEICPPLIDIFDDGSGKDRVPRLIDDEMISNKTLENLYTFSRTT